MVSLAPLKTPYQSARASVDLSAAAFCVPPAISPICYKLTALEAPARLPSGLWPSPRAPKNFVVAA